MNDIDPITAAVWGLETPREATLVNAPAGRVRPAQVLGASGASMVAGLGTKNQPTPRLPCVARERRPAPTSLHLTRPTSLLALNTHGQTGAGSRPGALLRDGEVQPGISPQASGQWRREPPLGCNIFLTTSLRGGEPKDRRLSPLSARSAMTRPTSVGGPRAAEGGTGVTVEQVR